MKISIFLIGLFAPFFAMVAQCQSKAVSEHVVLISIDGFRPDFYLEERWPAPVIKAMAKEGSHAKGVRGVFPSVTYPSHTTIMTGVLPIKHGIYYNTPFEPLGQTGRWYWETAAIKSNTLWHAVKKANKKSASFMWPVSVGAPVDYNIPETWSLEKGYGRIKPLRDHQSPPGFLEEMEKAVLGKLNEKTFSGDYMNREDRLGEMAAYTLETYKPSLITLHLLATDHFQHEQGREGPKVFTALAAADRAIGKIKEAAERAGILNKTTFIITGDHGFVDIHTTFCPNYWLVEAGLMMAQKNRGDWKATFHTSGAAAFLHVKNAKDEKSVQVVLSILNKLPAHYRKLFRVVDRAELDKIGTDPNVVLALAPIKGVNMSSSYKQPIRAASGGTHGYFPDFKEIQTGFIAWGAGINPKTVLPIMGLEDIAPLVSHLLQLDFKSADGMLYPGLIVKQNSP